MGVHSTSLPSPGKHTSMVLKTGFALKEGHFFRTWRRRWCVLRARVSTDPPMHAKATHFLLYYKVAGAPDRGAHGHSQSKQNPGFILCGVVPLTRGATQVSNTTRSGHTCLCVVTPGMGNTLFLEPENDMEGWQSVLENLPVTDGEIAMVHNDPAPILGNGAAHTQVDYVPKQDSSPNAAPLSQGYVPTSQCTCVFHNVRRSLY